MTTADMALGQLTLDPASSGPSTFRYARRFGLAVILIVLVIKAIIVGIMPIGSAAGVSTFDAFGSTP